MRLNFVLAIYWCWPVVELTAQQNLRGITASSFNISRDGFVQLGIALENADEPKSALRAFRAALLLLDEEPLVLDELENVGNFIRRWIRNTKTRRLGAFKRIVTVLQVGDDPPKELHWVMGNDLQEEADTFCKIHYVDTAEDCYEIVLQQLLIAEEAHLPPPVNGKRPPRHIPDDLFENFTRGYAPVIDMYRDDSQPGYYQEWTAWEFDEFAALVRHRQAGVNYPEVDHLLYTLLDGPPGPVHAALVNKSVAVMGSATPWYEVLALEFGAGETVTVEYNRLRYKHPRMRTLTPSEYWSPPPPQGQSEAAASASASASAASLSAAAEPQPLQRFDLALSISSFEHDGLGRYGDPISPDGDMAAMRQMEAAVAPGGVLLLAVPVAADAIVWNCHRVYGRRRLTALLERWTVRRVLGLADAMFDQIKRFPSQPVFVLENTRPARPLDFGDDGWADGVVF